MSDAEKPTEPAPAEATPEKVEEPEAPAQEEAPKGAEPEEVKPAAVAEPEDTNTEEAKPEEAKPEEAKPEEAKPEEAKPAEGGEAEEAAAEEETPAPEPIVIPEGNGELVLVTGATGYLASHIVKQLVESGQFKVRGSVRSIEENAKLDKLKSLVQDNSKYELEFVEADLTNPESWTQAVKGCDYVIHSASPFPVSDPSDESEVIDPARDGTLSVLKACVEAGTVKRVVLTSSIFSITGGRTLDKNACSEEMWADPEKTPSAYDKSKAIAEKAAWDFIEKELPEGSSLELSVVNPGFVVGPPLMNMDCTSVEVIKRLMNREYSILPKLNFACIDVRDAALAHIRAMVIKQAAGRRHIVCGTSVWLKDLANMMSQEFNSQGFNIPTTQAPYVLVWMKSHFDPAIKRILPEIGRVYNFDTTRMREILQIEPREVKDSVIEMGHAMINLEIVQKVEKPAKKQRKLTFRKKKEKVLEEGEEKKDEPEKAASTSGSAENGSVPDAIAIEDVEVIADESPKETQTQEEKAQDSAAPAEEVKPEDEDEKQAEAATSEEETVKDEATTSDPESSKKKDKKEKPKKEKKEKKKGGLFSFSFKKSKKPHVEKKSADDKEGASEETAAAATEETPASVTEETPAAVTEETPAATTEETPAATTEETPAATAEETPAATEETPAATAEETPAAATEETPAATAEETPAATAEETPAVEESKAPVEATPQTEEAPVATEE